MDTKIALSPEERRIVIDAATSEGCTFEWHADGEELIRFPRQADMTATWGRILLTIAGEQPRLAWALATGATVTADIAWWG